MGKPTGFLEYYRQEKSVIPPLKRIKNFDEFKEPMSPEERRVQAARCMDCGIPFCQSCIQLAGMWTGCPLHNLIPEYNDLLYRGNWKMALSRLLKTNNFPEFTGRVCPALCEAACTCGLDTEPVTAHDNELEIIEKGFREGWVLPRIPKVRTNKRIAVVGSGPAGLAAADCLNKRGHNVTVFERENRPGGLLMYGIPNMKLDKKVIERRIKLMEKEGVEFKCNVNVGEETNSKRALAGAGANPERFLAGAGANPEGSLAGAGANPERSLAGAGANLCAEELIKDYDAVILACGSKEARDLNVPGRDAKGVYFAVDFLTAATKKVTGQIKEFEISAEGKNVVIIGGGDTGNDCVGTSIRQKCKTVTQLEMMPAPPLSRAQNNPWPHWPLVLKVDYGQQEAIAVFGNDPRIYQTTVKEIIKDSEGRVKELVTIKLESKVDPSTGRRFMGEIEGTEEVIPCELLLIAAGFTGCEKYVADAFGLARGPRGTLQTLPDSYMVSVESDDLSKDGAKLNVSPKVGNVLNNFPKDKIKLNDSVMDEAAPDDSLKYEAAPGFVPASKIFAAGDARRGQSLVVWGIAEGRACAKEVDEFLMGYTNL